MGVKDENAVEKPSIRELEILHAMIVTGRTVSAARALGLSQPAVSRALAILEGKIGRRMFNRDGNRLVPTTEALALDSAAVGILDALELLSRPGGPAVAGETVRLAASPTLAHFLLPSIVASFRRARPEIVLDVEIARGTDVLSAVADHRVDIGIVDAPPSHPAVRSRVFRYCRAHVILPEEHPLAGEQSLGPARLAKEPFVALARRFPSRADFDRAFHQARIRQIIVAEASTVAFAVELVRTGVGLTIVNPFPLTLCGLTGLSAVPFEPSVRYATAMLAPSTGPRSGAASAFAEHLMAYPIPCPTSQPPE